MLVGGRTVGEREGLRGVKEGRSRKRCGAQKAQGVKWVKKKGVEKKGY